MKFLCDQCKAKYQIADEKAAGKTVRMKCRKCGHLIEVRATVTESAPPPAPQASSASAQAPAPYRGAAAGQPSAPRAAPLATSLASAKPAARDRSGALAGAFQSSVQRDEETSAPIDMSDLSPNDEWYVAINGVPVGPIRIAEIRRKAALGGVTEESLAWQEGLDEWRAVRYFPELAAIVREAITSGRSSIAPMPPGRASAPPPPPRAGATGARPANPTAPPRAAPPARAPVAPVAPMATAPAARSNVVPITSRLATAERLETPQPTVMPDPFGSSPLAPSPAMVPGPPSERVAMASPMSLAAPIPLATEPRSRRPTPWVAIGMVAAFVAFGVTVGIAAIPALLHPAPQPAPASAPVALTPAPPTLPPTATPAPATPDPPLPTVAAAPVKPAGAGAKLAVAAAPASTPTTPAARALDLHSLTQNQTSVAPTEEAAGDAPKAPGQCFSSGQVQVFVSTHQAAIQRTCWERNPSNKSASNVSVSLTVDNDGSVQGVSASGDDVAIAKCIENEVRGWHFPAMGCSQRMNIPFHFVRQ